MSNTIDMRKSSHNESVQKMSSDMFKKGLDKGEIFKRILVRYSVDKKLGGSLKEWSWFLAYRDDHESFCFCSHRDILIHFYIFNRFNGNILRVGSECVNPFIDTKTLGKFKRTKTSFSIYRCPICRDSGTPFSKTHPVCQDCCSYSDPKKEVTEVDVEYEPDVDLVHISDSEDEKSEEDEDEDENESDNDLFETSAKSSHRRKPTCSSSSRVFPSPADIHQKFEDPFVSLSSSSDEAGLSFDAWGNSYRPAKRTERNFSSSKSIKKIPRIIRDTSSDSDDFDTFLKGIEIRINIPRRQPQKY